MDDLSPGVHTPALGGADLFDQPPGLADVPGVVEVRGELGGQVFDRDAGFGLADDAFLTFVASAGALDNRRGIGAIALVETQHLTQGLTVPGGTVVTCHVLGQQELVDVAAPVDGALHRGAVFDVRLDSGSDDVAAGGVAQIRPVVHESTLDLDLAIRLDGEVVVHVFLIERGVLHELHVEVGQLLPARNQPAHQRFLVALEDHGHPIGVGADDVGHTIEQGDHGEQGQLPRDCHVGRELGVVQAGVNVRGLAVGAVGCNLEHRCGGVITGPLGGEAAIHDALVNG